MLDALSITAKRGGTPCLLIALWGCSPAAPARPELATPEERGSPEEPFRVLSPYEPAPKFDVVASDGTRFDSEELLGKKPFVLVFFATWCRVCEMKVPEAAAVLREAAPMTVIGVSLDEPEDADQVPGFLARHRFSFPTVSGTAHPRFALAYDPLQTVPVVAVIGPNGYLIDYQIGYSVTHRSRLAAALEIARRMPRDAPPFLGGRTPDDPGQ